MSDLVSVPIAEPFETVILHEHRTSFALVQEIRFERVPGNFPVPGTKIWRKLGFIEFRAEDVSRNSDGVWQCGGTEPVYQAVCDSAFICNPCERAHVSPEIRSRLAGLFETRR